MIVKSTSLRDWLFYIDWVTLIIHSSSQSSPINQLAWMIILVVDKSATIRQWLFNQPARVIDYWLFNQSARVIEY